MLPGVCKHIVVPFLLSFWVLCLGSPELQADSPHAFPAFVEDQPLKVVSQIAKGEHRSGTGQADGAHYQAHAVLLMGEDMLEMGPDRRLCSISAITSGMGLSLGLRR